MAQNNAINNQSSQLTVDPAAASDSFIQFDESTTGKWRIGNDATDDSYRLSQGSALGTNDTFVMTSAGERTMPLQPAFLAHLASTDASITGQGGSFTLGDTDTGTTLTEIFDQNGDFTPGASGGATFDAPVTGKYNLESSITFTGTNNGAYAFIARYITSNRSYSTELNATPNAARAQEGIAFSALCDMDASDTCTFLIIAIGSGAVDVGVIGSASPYRTYVCGHLAC